MADDLIHCPACGFQLRLPTDLYGTAVECPQCHGRFTAPIPIVKPVAPVRPPPGREYDAVGQRDAAEYDYAPQRSGGSVAAPAIALLVVGVLGIAADVLGIAWAQIAPDNRAEYDRGLQQELNKNPNLTPQQRKELTDICSLDNVVHFLNLDCGISVALNLITALGAIQMLRGRTYGLAVLGCVAALNPANLPTCCLQVPFGIWGLIALMSESGRRAFR